MFLRSSTKPSPKRAHRMTVGRRRLRPTRTGQRGLGGHRWFWAVRTSKRPPGRFSATLIWISASVSPLTACEHETARVRGSFASWHQPRSHAPARNAAGRSRRSRAPGRSPGGAAPGPRPHSTRAAWRDHPPRRRGAEAAGGRARAARSRTRAIAFRTRSSRPTARTDPPPRTASRPAPCTALKDTPTAPRTARRRGGRGVGPRCAG